MAKVSVSHLVFAKQNEVVACALLGARFIVARAVGNVYFATYYGFNTLFFASLIEIYRAEHSAVVGYGNGAMPHRCGYFGYFGNTARAVEKAVFRV
jgi:hypothetical protein